MLYNKPVAVLGGGNGAHALAADLTARGFQVNLYEMPGFKGNMQKVFETKEIIATGAIEGTFLLNKVTDDIEYALAGVKYIIILTPAFAHDAYARLLKGKVNSDQVIVSVPGAFLTCTEAWNMTSFSLTEQSSSRSLRSLSKVS